MRNKTKSGIRRPSDTALKDNRPQSKLPYYIVYAYFSASSIREVTNE